MRRSASEVLRDLEIRIARLEKSALKLNQPNTIIRTNKKGLINATLKKEVALEAFNELSRIPRSAKSELIMDINREIVYGNPMNFFGPNEEELKVIVKKLRNLKTDKFFNCTISRSKKMGSDWMELNLFWDTKQYDRLIRSVDPDYFKNWSSDSEDSDFNKILNKVLKKVFSRLMVTGVEGYYKLNNIKEQNKGYRL